MKKLLRATLDYVRDDSDDVRTVLPFYWLLMAVLAVMYIWALLFAPNLHEPLRLVGFTVLFLLHAGLHWLAPRLTRRQPGMVAYLVVQGLLAFAITLLAGYQGITIGLFLGMAGEAVGLLEDLRRSAIAVAAYVALAVFSFALMWGLDTLGWVFLVVVPLGIFVAVYVAIFNRQDRERQRAQALLRELETAHRQLSEYAAKVEDLTRGAERQRMARELHDTLAQGLAGLILQLEALQANLEKGDTNKAALIASQAQDRARAALAEARRAIDDLRVQSESTLSDVIRAEAERFSAATGIPCVLQLTQTPTLSAAEAEHARRFVSEGLTNIARHARASHASISLRSADGTARLELCDDGIGFEPATTIGQAGHYGLLGLRERARLAGGKLDIASAAGKGTVLKFSLPLEESINAND